MRGGRALPVASLASSDLCLTLVNVTVLVSIK